MPHQKSARQADPVGALIVVSLLAVASVAIAFFGVAPSRVSATELLGDARTPGDQAFIASHRGGAAVAPENTLPAITQAITDGFDYVEVDVALTSDGYPVLMHDATVDRTTNGHGRLADLTLAEVRSLDAGVWFDRAYSGTPVPTFTEFADLLASTAHRALIELKGVWHQEAINALVAELSSRGLERSVALVSFDARTLALVSATATVAPTMVILRNLPDDIVQAARDLGVRGVIVERRALLKEPHIVDELHAEAMRVVVYTLNKDSQWDAVTAIGVDGIVTDHPATLHEWQQAASAR